jgi:hypothetical protein
LAVASQFRCYLLWLPGVQISTAPAFVGLSWDLQPEISSLGIMTSPPLFAWEIESRNFWAIHYLALPQYREDLSQRVLVFPWWTLAAAWSFLGVAGWFITLKARKPRGFPVDITS